MQIAADALALRRLRQALDLFLGGTELRVAARDLGLVEVDAPDQEREEDGRKPRVDRQVDAHELDRQHRQDAGDGVDAVAGLPHPAAERGGVDEEDRGPGVPGDAEDTQRGDTGDHPEDARPAQPVAPEIESQEDHGHGAGQHPLEGGDRLGEGVGQEVPHVDQPDIGHPADLAVLGEKTHPLHLTRKSSLRRDGSRGGRRGATRP